MPTNQKALVILISQSGETADTLAALRLAKEEGIMTLAFVNVVGSLCCYNKGIQRTVGSNVLSDRSVCKGQRKNHRRTVQLLYLRAADHPGKDAENSYIHSEVYAAGELKHGTISLIEQGTLVIGVLTQSELDEKTISNMLEYKSRGAYLMGMTTYGKYETEDQVNFTVYVPKVDEHFVGSLAVISLQLLGYYVSVAKGLDVDKPRNLAKSVTVE